MEKTIDLYLDERCRQDILRDVVNVSIEPSGLLSVDGRKYHNFSSNDYLGLSSHPDMLRAVKDPSLPVLGSGASRLMTGSDKLFKSLEKNIAELKNKPSALIFNSGYQANVGVISALCGKGDIVFSDRLNHASILDGIKLSGARMVRFRHNDLGHLDRLLSNERGKYRNSLIITETVFSMDGDIAPVKGFVDLKKRHNCLLMADEAHATGLFGKNGEGIIAGEDLSRHYDIVMGTFSKALGSFGAYVAISEKMRKYLINSCRSFIYSTALPLPILNANLQALHILKYEPNRRVETLRKAAYLREKIKELGLDVKGETHIVPVMIGSSKDCVRVSEKMKEKGFWVMPVRQPTVPPGSSRIRLSMTYNHGIDTIDKLLDALSASIGPERLI